MNSRIVSILVFVILSVVSPVLAFGDSYDLPALIKKVRPAVVKITVYDQSGKEIKEGSGFFVSEVGDLITNYHVLDGASSACATTYDAKKYIINNHPVLAKSVERDLAEVDVFFMTKSEGKAFRAGRKFPKFPRLRLAASVPQVGERIIVIGSPLGLQNSVSEGIISAVREVKGLGKILQITAPISPGSSGSPVVNMKGEVVGVATFLVKGGENLNFAISISQKSIASLSPRKGFDLGTAEPTVLPGPKPPSNKKDECDKQLVYLEKVSNPKKAHSLEKEHSLAKSWIQSCREVEDVRSLSYAYAFLLAASMGMLNVKQTLDDARSCKETFPRSSCGACYGAEGAAFAFEGHFVSAINALDTAERLLRENMSQAKARLQNTETPSERNADQEEWGSDQMGLNAIKKLKRSCIRRIKAGY